MSARASWLVACGIWASLALLGLAWEIALAPLRPGGSWLALKVVPLLFALPGLLRKRRYTFKWSTLLVWAYFVEGATRAFSEPGLSARLATAEAVLAVAYVAFAVAFLRARR